MLQKIIKLLQLTGCSLLLSVSMAAAAGTPIKIAIANFGPDPTILRSIEGFKQEMSRLGYTQGDKVVYAEKQINFDPSLISSMVNELKGEQPKVMLALTTPVAQSARKLLEGTNIPIVFSVVTDPVAAKLVPSWTKAAPGITGASDYLDYAAVLEFIHKLYPKAKNIALGYNPGEDNDVASLKALQEAAPAFGLNIVPAAADNVANIAIAVAALQGKADVIFVAASNLFKPSLPAVSAAARRIGIPVVTMDFEEVNAAISTAAFSLDYMKVGVLAAQQTAKILAGTKAEDIPPARLSFDDYTPVISAKGMADLGLPIPAAFDDCNCVVK